MAIGLLSEPVSLTISSLVICRATREHHAVDHVNEHDRGRLNDARCVRLDVRDPAAGRIGATVEPWWSGSNLSEEEDGANASSKSSSQHSRFRYCVCLSTGDHNLLAVQRMVVIHGLELSPIG